MAKKTNRVPAAAAAITFSPRRQLIVSALLVLHLMAVVIAPMATPPRSTLSGMIFQYFRPYLELAFLNHGYRFFAPDPGPTTLIRYELEMPDGTRRDGVFPNLTEQWPRLLYHRHMMLSDQLNGAQLSGAPWADIDTRSFAQHLLAAHGARRVRLFARTHAIPSPQDVQKGMRLDDPVLFLERPLIDYAGETP